MEQLGFELPNPDKPAGRTNNRKMAFDSACRALLFDIAKNHGLQLEEEPEYAAKRLDGVITKIKNTIQTAVQKIQTALLQPEIKKSGTEQIKTQARASVLDKLNRKKEAIRQNTQHKSVNQKLDHSSGR